PPNHEDNLPAAGTRGTTKPKETQRTPTSNQGKLLSDATCAPSAIAYPTDVNLLNEAREKLEGIIDTLHAPLVGLQRKPRTYRRKARKQYLALSKQRQPSTDKIRKGIHQQLGYVRRNLKQVCKRATKSGLHK